MHFVAHLPREGQIGTDLTLDIVDYADELDGLKLGEKKFDPDSPAYLVGPSYLTGIPPQYDDNEYTERTRPLPQLEQDSEYKHYDLSEVMWTSTTYDEPSQDEEYDVEDEEEDEGDYYYDEGDEEEGLEDYE